MPRADLACIDGIVAELVIGNGTVLKTYKSIAPHHMGIELHLHLRVQGDCL